MRKVYNMFLALMLLAVGTTSAMGQKIYQAELDNSMFKAWTSADADAVEVTNPQPIDVSDNNPSGTAFACDNNFFMALDTWKGIWGSSAAYYLWYADLTGTQKMYFKGTPGLKFWIQFNRQAPLAPDADGYDPHGSSMSQTELTIGEDGTVSYDVSSLPYVHLNCIKTKTDVGVTGGQLKSVILEGTIKPVSGLMSLISNGDAEGTDLASFPVSLHAFSGDGDQAAFSPEIVDGGVSGKCFKVVSDNAAAETWSTQFFVKFDEALQEGDNYVLSFYIKADRNASVSSSAQGEPRKWHAGFVDAFDVTTEWQKKEFSGTVTADQAKDGGFLSIAFDLNNDKEVANTFYFDNIQMSKDLGGGNPMSSVSVDYSVDVIRLNLNNTTNVKALVGTEKVVQYPVDAFTVTWNGKPTTLLNVEARPDGNIYLFVDNNGDQDFYDQAADIKVSYVNPSDKFHVTFSEGKFEGIDLPDFTNLQCSYVDAIQDADGNDIVSSMWGAPELVEAVPEVGSFNLDANMKEFTVTFNVDVEVATVVAKLGDEDLTASADGKFAKTVKLTRTGSAELAGENDLVISKAVSEKGTAIENEDQVIRIKYSFGPVVLSGDDAPETLMTDGFANKNEARGAGWMVHFAGTDQPASSGSGCRIIDNGAQAGQGFTPSILYLGSRGTSENGYATYGTLEDYRLTLKAKTYHLKAYAARWDGGTNERTLKAEVLDMDENVIAEMTKAIVPEYKTSTDATLFDLEFTAPQEGNYILKFTAGNKDGNPGNYEDASALGKVSVEYIPNVMGYLEMAALTDSLQKAKDMLTANSGERYAGEAYSALDATVNQYDGATLTAPSAFAKAYQELHEKMIGLKAHRANCDYYDAAIKKTVDIVRQVSAEEDNGKPNLKRKFMDTEYYQQAVAAAEKYHASSEWVDLDENPDDEVTNWQLKYTYDVLTDDAELKAAAEELAKVNIAEKVLTVGASVDRLDTPTSGYAAEYERIRRGVELLKTLGVAEDAEVIDWANKTMGDDDEVSQAIMNQATLEILNALSQSDNTLFEGVTNPETEEVTYPTYDMSVFVKNPNLYALANSTEVPGWTAVKGSVNGWTSWNGGLNHSANTPYVEDAKLHAGWHPANGAAVEQTITNLPAGVYKLVLTGSDNAGNPMTEGTYNYYKLSNTPEVAEGEEFNPDVNYAGYTNSPTGTFEDVVITDGQLTLGFAYGPNSQAFLNGVEIYLTGAAESYNYVMALESFKTGVDAAQTAKVRSVQLFDLNGRRISTARKGLVIVKKQMSDGTVKTEKVIK
jgi:hypothetical protein